MSKTEKIDLKNATDECAKLMSEYPKIRFGLLHGKMKPTEKDEIIAPCLEKDILRGRELANEPRDWAL